MSAGVKELSRRRFVGGCAVGTVAFAVQGCVGTVGGEMEGDPPPGVDPGPTPPPPGPPPPTGDGSPVWSSLPTIQFVVGVASTFSIAEYVSDPDGDELMVMLNDVPLPAGVTFDPAGMAFVYDGSGPVATTSGHVLTADDGT